MLTKAEEALAFARARRAARSLVTGAVWQYARARAASRPGFMAGEERADAHTLWVHLAVIVAQHEALHEPAYTEARQLIPACALTDGEEGLRVEWDVILDLGRAGTMPPSILECSSIPVRLRDPTMRAFFEPRLAKAYLEATRGEA